MMRTLLALALFVLMAGTPQVEAQVRVAGGMVGGSEAPGGGAILFRGIPYAAPPIGPLRWRAPQPVAPWQGTRADQRDPPACLQNDYGWNRGEWLRSAEDCLTLDVRTPALHGRLPVMVWIHGGSNRAGSARGMVQSRITDQGVVLVAIQYRLGIFGFLSHRGAAAEAGGASGNYGLMDQIAALKWVRENIAAFGGDPDNVTIFGESAGSQDVSLLLAAPGARGLFHKAILQSGTPGFGMPFRPLEEALAVGDQADRLLDGGGSTDALRTRSTTALLEVDRKLADPATPGNDFVWLRTTIDGAVLAKSPRALLAEAPVRPVLIGSNRVEFGPGPGGVEWDKELPAKFGAGAARARDLYLGAAVEKDQRLAHPEMQFWTDWMFRCPAGRLAELLAGRGAPVWRYEFDLADGGALTAHAADVAWVMNDKRFGDGVWLQRYWTRFAVTGDPNSGGQPQWPRFDGEKRRHVLFDAHGVTLQSRLREPVCTMLEEL
ncbi:carboxylesterase/lipase family protein [Sphingomonas canadensis]|uniref:Carboxylic ester hydrolase n=1 Tax=Sphingomonas canadensis TaxID=1219257 RepID=A0ABW3HAL3_9SPHN|nr:carboxylesterase family protein [Sphingomonas canadensis]MCW3838280.1 carboxylesterase family protein [Sphingomonas canadensis]